MIEDSKENNGMDAQDFGITLREKLYNEEHMYTYVKGVATGRGFNETLKALPFARECHKGQFRKGHGKEPVPYIIHPLTMACHALALSLDDELVATALLHDTIEDCKVGIDNLPVNRRVKEAVWRVTKVYDPHLSDEDNNKVYYEEMKGDSMAMMVKLFDRCNNISNMSMGFTEEKIREKVIETEKYIMPMFDMIKIKEPMYSNACFVLKYHMMSVLEVLKRTL